MKMPLNPNPLEARQPGSGVAPTQGAQGATGVCATAGDRRDLDISPPDPEVTEAKPSLNGKVPFFLLLRIYTKNLTPPTLVKGGGRASGLR
jgi:hypothetical protein